MFKPNTIGAHINAILKKHGEDDFDGVSFEAAVKHSSPAVRTLCTHNSIVPEKKHSIVNPRTGKRGVVEDWIALIHRTILRLERGPHSWTEGDWKALLFINIALKLEYRDIYYDYFD
jgi:hypothetical protein